MLVKLLVDAESFFEETVLGLLGDLSELNSIIVVKSVDVVHHASSFRADSSQDQKVL